MIIFLVFGQIMSYEEHKRSVQRDLFSSVVSYKAHLLQESYLILSIYVVFYFVRKFYDFVILDNAKKKVTVRLC